jgi:hypothetical protein
MPCAARRLDRIAGVFGREKLSAVNFVKFVMLTAEIAVDCQFAQVGERGIDFFLAQHFEHIADLFTVAAAMKAWMSGLEYADCLFPE